MGFLCFLSLSLFFFILSVSSLRFPPFHDVNKTMDVPSMVFNPTGVTQLSWTPRVFLYKGFLSEKECDHLINMARGNLEKSLVAAGESGESVMSKVRTSSGMFLTKAQDEIISDIEARIAIWTLLPIENGEPIQVLRYEHDQKYDPHVDFFDDKYNLQFGGNRVATVLMYLSNVVKGGETVFPMAKSQPKDNSWSECAKMGYAVKPVKGDALLFFSIRPNATTDNSSLHGSCAVIDGEKWSATKWIHANNFDIAFEKLRRSKVSKLVNV